MARKNSKHLGVAIDQQDHFKLLQIAVKQDIPLSQLVRKVLKEYLKKTS